jgi:hypothetical protein
MSDSTTAIEHQGEGEIAAPLSDVTDRHCVVCRSRTDLLCGDWCDECDGLPMCATCQEEHAEDLEIDR